MEILVTYLEARGGAVSMKCELFKPDEQDEQPSLFDMLGGERDE